MEIHVHIHHHADRSVDHKLDFIIKTLNKMPTKAEFDAAFARHGAAIQNIADDIRRLLEQQQQPGLTEAEEQAILDQLNASVDQLEALAAQTPEPPAPEA